MNLFFCAKTNFRDIRRWSNRDVCSFWYNTRVWRTGRRTDRTTSACIVCYTSALVKYISSIRIVRLTILAVKGRTYPCYRTFYTWPETTCISAWSLWLQYSSRLYCFLLKQSMVPDKSQLISMDSTDILHQSLLAELTHVAINDRWWYHYNTSLECHVHCVSHVLTGLLHYSCSYMSVGSSSMSDS